MNRILFGLAVICGASAFAADPKADMLKHLEASKSFTMDVANAMSVTGYTAKAEDKVEPPDRTFGEIMVHIAQSTYGACAAIAGEKAPAPPSAADKTAVVQFVSQAFDTCLKATAKEETLERMVKRGANEVSVREILWGTLVHDAHHRGQVEVYLRLQGVKPPAYRF